MLYLQEDALLAEADSDVHQQHPVMQATNALSHTENAGLSKLLQQMLHTDAAARPQCAEVVALLIAVPPVVANMT